MERITAKRRDEFIAALEEAGGSSGNGALRGNLDWSEEFYWKVQGHLIEQGLIVAGRGKGGSVRLTEAQAAISDEPNKISIELPVVPAKERDLYADLKATIETRWINRFALDDVLVDETHSRGSRNTGGTFTRPDITAAGVRRYVYLPKRLEIVTFEVKPASNLSVMGVLEAIALREAAHRSYVIFATSRAKFEASTESERILELSQKYGIGLLLTERPKDVETWEVLLDAIRHEPDPSRLDRFLIDLPNELMKKQLSKWKE